MLRNPPPPTHTHTYRNKTTHLCKVSCILSTNLILKFLNLVYHNDKHPFIFQPNVKHRTKPLTGVVNDLCAGGVVHHYIGCVAAHVDGPRGAARRARVLGHCVRREVGQQRVRAGDGCRRDLVWTRSETRQN